MASKNKLRNAHAGSATCCAAALRRSRHSNTLALLSAHSLLYFQYSRTAFSHKHTNLQSFFSTCMRAVCNVRCAASVVVALCTERPALTMHTATHTLCACTFLPALAHWLVLVWFAHSIFRIGKKRCFCAFNSNQKLAQAADRF